MNLWLYIYIYIYMKLFAKWFGTFSEPWLVDWISEPSPVSMFVCFWCSMKLRMIPIFRGCFYLRPSYHKVDKNLGSMSGLPLGNQSMWITCVHPPNVTWNPKMKVWKMRFLFGEFQVPAVSFPVEWLWKLLWRIPMILMIFVMHCPVWSDSNLQLEWPLGP